MSARPAGACHPNGISDKAAGTSMTDQPLDVTAGVDTHGHTHHAASNGVYGVRRVHAELTLGRGTYLWHARGGDADVPRWP